MYDNYRFREIKKEEVPQMFQLILERMQWMDKKGIRQWNEAHYEEIYPLSYYEEKRLRREVFVLEDVQRAQMVCAAVLREEDERWPDEAAALYLHNFASRVGEKGVGQIFLEKVEAYALQKGKEYVRLDCAEDNPFLSRYYEARGFQAVGTCEEGGYRGILQQKRLVKQNGQERT